VNVFNKPITHEPVSPETVARILRQMPAPVFHVGCIWHSKPAPIHASKNFMAHE